MLETMGFRPLVWREGRGRMRAALGRVALTCRIWSDRWRTRQYLADLPEERLRDLGITEAEAAVEARKPFWRY